MDEDRLNSCQPKIVADRDCDYGNSDDRDPVTVKRRLSIGTQDPVGGGHREDPGKTALIAVTRH